jgi:hypothetical protein
MIGHGTLFAATGTDWRALLYHHERPCANPAVRGMMNKQQPIGVESGPWLTD